MNGFALPKNFTKDPEKLLRKKKFVEARDKFESPSRTPSATQASSLEEPVTPDLGLNRINRRLILASCNFFSGSSSPKNFEVKHAWPGEI